MNQSFTRVIKYPLLFEVEVVNESSYSREIVWENAQDVEHVATLHTNTNFWFRILSYTSDFEKPIGSQYDYLSFLAKRKVAGFIKIGSVGARRLVEKYKIQQLEISPLLQLYTVLHSTIEPNPNDKNGSLLRDRVLVYGPTLFKPLQQLMKKEIIHHAKQQCVEDETFRARRVELQARGIKIPFRLLDKSLFEVFFENT